MKRFFFYCLSFLLFSSCGQTNSNHAIQPDTTRVSVQADSVLQSRLTRLDSIEQENSVTIANAGPDVNKAIISNLDSSIFIGQDKYMDHRIFGYERPDINSKKLILFSSFTKDVEGNPFRCPLGAFYSSDLMDDLTFKYLATEGQFVKAKLIHKGAETIVYIERNWVTFSE